MTTAPTDVEFATMVRDHGAGVYRFLAGTLGDPVAAEDLSQDVFAKAYRGLAGLSDPAAARSWLFAIAANTARNHQAREKSRHWLPMSAARAVEAPDPAQVPARLALAEALGTLSREERAVLLLIGYLGFSASEAAEQMGLSLAATHKRWQRACAKLREQLGGERP